MPIRTLTAILIMALACINGWGADVVPEYRQVFNGVRYCKLVKTSPVLQVIHLVEIDLSDPCIHFTTTPSNGPEEKKETRCETTLEFVKRNNAQVGINGNYFFYDKETDTELLGLAVSNGSVVSPWDSTWAKFAINIGKDNKVVFIERPDGGEGTAITLPPVSPYNVLTGNKMVLLNGSIHVEPGGDRHPRTGISLTGANKLLLLVADGRQPGYSEGMTYHEMANALLECGAVNALALDGGGSSTLVLADPDPRVVNVPIPTEMPGGIILSPPGIERKNGNNLAVFAAPASADAVQPATTP